MLLLENLRCTRPVRPAVWVMRQAGRYLPEYRALRKESCGFLNMCTTPALAAEITLQPIRRFGMDGAIIFSDILLVPHALGLHLEFHDGRGPMLEKLSSPEQVCGLREKLSGITPTLTPTCEALKRVRKDLPNDKTLIGFCGAPWTLLLYMLDEKPSQACPRALEWAKNHPAAFENLLDALVEASISYLCLQIKAGADVVQIFDSWAVSCPSDLFETAILRPLLKICEGVRAVYPETPVILFPRAVSDENLRRLCAEGAGLFEGLGLSQTHDMARLCQELPDSICLQGNFDPDTLLLTTPEQVKKATVALLETVCARPGHIMNLGHGIHKETPVENMAAFIETVLEYSKVEVAA